ncbi:immunoglobulin E-set [Leucosporidium creatinivorum]|uniref:Immunoglobulin E-set n=1 Tax=Leucosporidium creatinivorum TaxID=106004 RepID=A0A1Y2E166_9BASI|nr:immunoglobulin E-set [Leucosporidium creatinivorum]
MSDLYAHQFTWAGQAESVIATGSFDEWKSTLPLTRNNEGKLSATLPIKYGEKITFKYIVDGSWQHNPDEPFESDASGNINNVFTAPEAPVAPVVIPTGEGQEKQPVLPVPESIATTDAVAVSPAVISEPATAPAAEEKKEEESAGLIAGASEFSSGVGFR